MKKLIIFAMLLAICSLSSYAQTSSSRLTEEQKNEWKARLDAYREKLNLTDEQKPKVEEANMDYLAALAEIRESGGSKLSKYRKYKQANNERDKKMKGILSKEQYKIYKEQQEEFKEELKARRTQP